MLITRVPMVDLVLTVSTVTCVAAWMDTLGIDAKKVTENKIAFNTFKLIINA